MKTKLLTLCLTSSIIVALAQGPQWDSIKANYQPIIGFPSEYETPYIQNHANGGWEDGIYISRNGLHMYTFYSPVDIITYAGDIDTSQACEYPVIAPYWRGPMIGVDTATTIGPCTHWLHSDVVHASRTDGSSSFSPWTPTDINDQLYYEGAPQVIAKSNDSLDAFLYTRTTSGYVDIYIMRDITYNPTDIGKIIDTINIKSPSGAEDNPHMEKINDSTYVLFFDDTYNGNTNMEIYFSMSTDGGNTWQPAQQVTSLSSTAEDIMPHLWYDGTDWWIYYATSDPGITDGRLHIVRRKQTNQGDWLNWGSPQVVINPGSISGGFGEVLGVGEPTLTQWGDISFSVIYGNSSSMDTTDLWDSDPWFLPRKGSALSIESKEVSHTVEFYLYPNPANQSVTINTSIRKGLVQVISITGQVVQTEQLNNGNTVISTTKLPSGMYIIQIDGESEMTRKKLIVNH